MSETTGRELGVMEVGSGVYLFPLPPAGVDLYLWIQFIEDRCFRCETPRDGCTIESIDRERIIKCFDRWLKLLELKSSPEVG